MSRLSNQYNDTRIRCFALLVFSPDTPNSVPELLVLNDCDIDEAGEPDDLAAKCRTVKELDLAQNNLHNWREVFTILSNMPRVEFVNLSLNRLCGPVERPAAWLRDGAGGGLGCIRNLVLNNTRLDWDGVETIITMLPVLEELHLSLNDYRNVLIDTIDDYLWNVNEEEEVEEEEEEEGIAATSAPCDDQSPAASVARPPDDSEPPDELCSCATKTTTATTAKRSDSTSSAYKKTNAHEGVRKLHFTGNPVSEWSEICRLGRVFPKLESLVLAECPLRAIAAAPKSPPPTTTKSPSTLPSTALSTSSSSDESGSDGEQLTGATIDTPHQYFRNLALLNLSSTQINTWDDIDRLAKFPALRNLRVQNWPLWEKCDATEHERRQLLIARLPYVQTLNGGGIINWEEREDAERAFIRYYIDKPEADRPERFAELVAVHGRLDPLVSIDLRPEKRVKVTFTYGDTSEQRSVDVYR